MLKVYMYVVARDFGFAPNPFHGICTLATCKPQIRNTAKVGDWVLGVGGSRLKATGKCIFAMKVTEKLTYDEYYYNPRFNDKKPVRNGSKAMLLGDNIYHKSDLGEWLQEHSHHSHPDGTINEHNLKRDTQSLNVLISEHFYYFGKEAPTIPEKILLDLHFKNRIGHRVYHKEAQILINWLEETYKFCLNLVMADPFDFDKGNEYYSVKTDKISSNFFKKLEEPD